MATRKEVKQIVYNIQNLAKDLQDVLDTGADPLFNASELVKESNKMVFALGEVFAEEARKASLKAAYANRVYVRDSRGRFQKR